MMLLDPSSGKHLVHSASDLTAFLECEALTALNLQALSDPTLAAQRVLPDEGTQLITDKGIAHEQAYLKRLLDAGLQVVDVAALAGRDPLDRLSVTRKAMAQGADVVYQAALMQGDLLGYADFLMRVPTPSGLGEWSYEVADTKLARSTKAKFLVQLSFYSHLLAPEQSLAPRHMHLVLGDQTQASRNTLKQHFRNLTERGSLNQHGSGRGVWYDLR